MKWKRGSTPNTMSKIGEYILLLHRFAAAINFNQHRGECRALIATR